MKKVIFLLLISFSSFLFAYSESDLPSNLSDDGCGLGYFELVSSSTTSKDIDCAGNNEEQIEQGIDSSLGCQFYGGDNSNYLIYYRIKITSPHYSYNNGICKQTLITGKYLDTQPPECTPDPKPAGLTELKVFTTNSDNVTGLHLCEDARDELGGYTDSNGKKWVNTRCWTNTCNTYPEDSATLFGMEIPSGFPQEDNNDTNNTHGTYVKGTLPIPQSDCNSNSTPDYSTSLGKIHVVGWDSAENKCVAMAFKCNNGFVLDINSNRCIQPPDTLELGHSSHANDSANFCSGGKWGQTWTYDFCDQCQGSVGIWLPPVGLEGYGLECNKKYVEYQCTTDYRLKKFIEVSCGNILDKDKTNKDLNLSNMDTTPTKDTNVSALPSADSTQAITTQLTKQVELQKDLNKKVSTVEGQNKLLKGINELGKKLDSINKRQLSQDGVKNGVKDALNERDNNLSIPDDANETGPGGDGLKAAKNAIINQYGKRYDLFGVSGCGSPSFDSSITFMGMTVENPLPVMDNSLKSYYPLFKSLFLLIATFLGFISVFRR